MEAKSLMNASKLTNDLANRIRLQARRMTVSAAALFSRRLGTCNRRNRAARDDVCIRKRSIGSLAERRGTSWYGGYVHQHIATSIGTLEYYVQELVVQTQRELAALLNHEQAPLAMCSGVRALAAPCRFSLAC